MDPTARKLFVDLINQLHAAEISWSQFLAQLQKMGDQRIFQMFNNNMMDPGNLDLMPLHFVSGIPVAVLKQAVTFPSGRPRTDMSTMIQDIPVSRSLDLLGTTRIQPENEILVAPEYIGQILTNVIVPVSRYGCTTGGCYNKKVTDFDNFCGTFYYFEPASDIVLRGHKMLVIENKYMAMKYFKLDPKDYISKDFFGKSLKKDFLGKIPIFKKMAADKSFGIFNEKLYAVEDDFDQILCMTAKNAGIDLILFAYMTGRKRIVSELLDTRSRTESFGNLLKL